MAKQAAAAHIRQHVGPSKEENSTKAQTQGVLSSYLSYHESPCFRFEEGQTEGLVPLQLRTVLVGWSVFEQRVEAGVGERFDKC